MIYLKYTNKTYDTKEAMFEDLKKFENKILSFKKSRVYKSVEKGQIGQVADLSLFIKSDTNKSLFERKEGFIYPVINTTNYMDSHDDVHFPGLWKKTMPEQKGRIYYMMAHSTNLKDVIAWPEDVNVFTADLNWADIGKNYNGKTQALVYEIPVSAIDNADAKKIIDKKRPVQNSVAMRYVIVKLGINSTLKEYSINKQYYDSRIDQIANKEQVEELGYFFGVEEAMIAGEGSMVKDGSNPMTPIIYNEIEPSKSLDNIEPSKDTQRKSTIINLLNTF